jgi:hypothetical protein
MTGLHSANSVLGSMDHEETTSSKLKTGSFTPVSIAGIRARRVTTAEIECYYCFN